MQQMNPAQERAVRFRDGCMLLLAGPGSGKTFVITHRIKALIDSGVDPGSILVITFTKAAALQMQDRFLTLVYPDHLPVNFGTFHAIFYSIIKHHHLYRKCVPITDKEKLNMIKRALEMCDALSVCRDYDDLYLLLGLISSCKNNGNEPEKFEQEMMSGDVFSDIFKAYNGLLKEFDRIDFDDMVNLCLELLKTDDTFRKSWQERFKYILIDEFQDISGNQYELVRLLAYPQMNIFAVGDDDQSIYAFRGANVGLMRRLLEDVPGAVKEELSVNYRSKRDIVSYAGKIISENKDRFEKHITAGRKDPGDIDKNRSDIVDICKCISRTDQNEHIISIIKDAYRRGVPFDDVAILVRTNRMGAEYAALLRANNIECSFSDSHIPFSSVYIRDIRAYMSIAAGNRSRENFLRIINRPVRYIKRASLTSETVDRQSLLDQYRSDRHMYVRVNELFMQLDRLKNMSPYLSLKYICNTIGYDRWVKEEISAEKYADYIEERDAFGLLIKNLRSYREVEDMLERIRGQEEEARKNAGNESGVHIMTYHGSKGLEFDTVILPDVNEHKIPARSAHTPFEIEEERRMFYVALTRAKNTLRILYRTDESLKPSRFLSL